MKLGPEVPNCYYRVSVKALITNSDGELLLVRERDTWDLPGGGLEWGEGLHDALQREAQEELGCTINIKAQPILIVPAVNRESRQQALWIIYRGTLDHDTSLTDANYETRYMTVDEFKQSDPAEEADWNSPVDFFQALREIV